MAYFLHPQDFARDSIVVYLYGRVDLIQINVYIKKKIDKHFSDLFQFQKYSLSNLCLKYSVI